MVDSWYASVVDMTRRLATSLDISKPRGAPVANVGAKPRNGLPQTANITQVPKRLRAKTRHSPNACRYGSSCGIYIYIYIYIYTPTFTWITILVPISIKL